MSCKYKILFLDQSGEPGGAELSLLDIATCFTDTCLVVLFADGLFRQFLEQRSISVQVLNTQEIPVRKGSGFLTLLQGLAQLLPIVQQVTSLCKHYDLIYANTQKALVVGAIASLLSRRALIFHLRDILSQEHFSWINRQLIITLCNRCCCKVISNSLATRSAFIEAGGNAALTEVIYNGFRPEYHEISRSISLQLRESLDVENHFVIGHFSRFGHWKGQHILIEALSHCPEQIMVLFAGGTFFGVEKYVTELHQQVAELGLQNRIKFLGFRADIPQLMSACDLIVHTSIAPEPFGRVIVEAMLSEKPVIAADAGGAVEIIEHGKTGWLTPPGDAQKLAKMICQCHSDPEHTSAVAQSAKESAIRRFNLAKTNQEIDRLLNQLMIN